jgi:CRP/FNR family transcriptional regulator, cyclic AMP receptor protein
MTPSGEGLQLTAPRRGGSASASQRLSHNCNLAVVALLFIAATGGNRPMNPAELFRQESNTVQLAPGDFLFREGEKGDKMYVLLEGEVDIFLGHFVFETASPGALLGEMALIDETPRTANAVAKTPAKLAQIDRRRFHFLVQQTPHFATQVMKTLADRLRHMNAVTAVR